ncbi:MAG: M23 family metallopeptidase [bacterium]|nr:M23 family metallopeptidase [bacterium]
MRSSGFVFISGALLYIVLSFSPISHCLSKEADASNSAAIDYNLPDNEDLLISEVVANYQWSPDLSSENAADDSSEATSVFVRKLIFERYTIKQGDTLWSIARDNRITVNSIIGTNKMKDKRVIVGKEIRIPNQNGIMYELKEMDSLKLICKKYKTDVKAVMEINDLNENPSGLSPGRSIFLPGAKPIIKIEEKKAVNKPQFAHRKYGEKRQMFILPVQSVVTSHFGYRNNATSPNERDREFHAGVDLRGRVGCPIAASADGQVIYNGYMRGYGKLLIIRHSNGFTTRYAHNSANLVSEGTYVRQGQVIALAGMTGRSTGPHIHFEIRKNNIPQNPMHYVN